MFEFKITDLANAPTIALGWATKAISLVDTSGIAKPFFGEKHQVFVFDDLNSEKEECHRPGMQHAPTMRDIRNILHFTDTIEPSDKVLIHCHGGISRSPAVAILTLVQHGDNIETAINRVHRARHIMWPNKLIIRLGDVALELNGELIEAVDKWMNAHQNDIVWE